MIKRMIFTRIDRRLGLLGALLVTASACQDLQVENLIAPDRERATANPLDVQAFVGGAFFPTYFNVLHDNESTAAAWFAPGAGMTATWDGQDTQLQYQDHLAEPRIAHDNGIVLSQGNGPEGPRNFWRLATSSATVAYDGLQLFDEGMIIIDGGVDVTPRARAFAKFMQGWTWGYLGLIFDEAHVLRETTDLPQAPGELLEVTLETLVPFEEVIAAAVGSLEEAIAVAQANPAVVHYPSFSQSPLWFGGVDPITNEQFIGMANTLAARLLVLGARDQAARRAVDWQRVLAFTANGVSAGEDWEMQLSSARDTRILEDAQENAQGDWNTRWDYRTIGPADQSGAYQAWISAPLSQRNRFDIVTPDRRITGETPKSDGSYTRYRADNNGFVVDRGTYLFSAYQWAKHAIELGKTGNDAGEDEGTLALITATENNLLRAEAMVHTGNLAGAAALINVSRTAPQTINGVEYPGLAPVTAAGVPNVAGVCVPRQDDGDCGTLLDAIRYERMIELAVVDPIFPYADSRGWGTLPDGALLQWPIPGNVLDLYGMGDYTYGGVGGEWSATYAPLSTP
jgi:hypothetical protein